VTVSGFDLSSVSIAIRAYELFEIRGGERGHDVEAWRGAETELFQSVPIQMVEIDEELTVLARMVGFRAERYTNRYRTSSVMITGSRGLDVFAEAATQ
jgi:hypothetical protein